MTTVPAIWTLSSRFDEAPPFLVVSFSTPALLLIHPHHGRLAAPAVRSGITSSASRFAESPTSLRPFPCHSLQHCDIILPPPFSTSLPPGVAPPIPSSSRPPFLASSSPSQSPSSSQLASPSLSHDIPPAPCCVPCIIPSSFFPPPTPPYRAFPPYPFSPARPPPPSISVPIPSPSLQTPLPFDLPFLLCCSYLPSPILPSSPILHPSKSFPPRTFCVLTYLPPPDLQLREAHHSASVLASCLWFFFCFGGLPAAVFIGRASWAEDLRGADPAGEVASEVAGADGVGVPRVSRWSSRRPCGGARGARARVNVFQVCWASLVARTPGGLSCVCATRRCASSASCDVVLHARSDGVARERDMGGERR
ncbi:hypothetical protein DFH09DRAFT_1330069 [Mycena vulgaris]|nr:hypothetical protein DFH09DRAFT_1330069 [Mycena vulgaris]